MASPATDLDEGNPAQESPPEAACREAQKWIEQVTGRSFGDKDFRTGLENGILLCELLNAIKPGLIKKINRLPTPIAGLDNVTLFLRGCKELGLKESQLFDPGDLQDTSNRTTVRISDCNRKLRNVLVTVYWLGKAANSCASYSGNHLDLKEFEGLLAQMRKENEEVESPKRSIRDSGYIDCWDSERSDSLSPPRHGRDDSFDSLDSFGSRSQQTPSPDVVLRGSSDGRGSDSESDQPHRRLPDVRKDDMSARRVSFGENKATVPFNQYLPNKSNQTSYIPAPLRKKRVEHDYRKSWSTATSPLGGERPFRSVSMCDMRYEDDGNMLPHSRAHHEHLQFVNDLLKEEDDTWQDDLARWKTRRRSASQDLIKKEEERKKMERLLSGEPDLTERRKSIKTYKEIVEEKERREKELHEAYKNAKTKEEADKILQKYIERFTISEAVLERIVMPKILERSHSVEPGLLSSCEDPNPLKYLRQQSLPSPKFTSTVEATISPTSESDFKAPLAHTSPTKSVVSKAVPMLTPKPYSQPRNTQHVLKTFKVDGKVSINGEAMNGTEEHKETASSAAHQMFAPSLTRSQMFEGVARVDVPAAVAQPDVSSIELSLKKPNVQNSVMDKEFLSEERNHSDVVDGKDWSLTTEVHIEKAAEGSKQQNPIVSSLEFTPSLAPTATVVNGKDQEEEQKVDPKSLTLDFKIKEGKETALQQVKTTQEDGQEALRKEQHGDTEISGSSAVRIPALNSPSRFCSWDPEEERRRQERWQQEQERLLQERYQKEQEKLKEEWEKAQKEVEEEERKYYEEERKIIEDTLMPLTVSPATSIHRGVCEMNGSMTSTTSEETWTEAKSCVKQAAEPEDIKPQVPPCTLERAINRPEEQKKGGSRLETEEMLTMTDKESNYTYQQCSTPTSLHLQLGVTSGSHGSEDVASLNNFEDCKSSQPRSPCVDSKGLDSLETSRDTSYSSQSSSQCQSPNRYKRSVSGKKLCSTCGQPLGKGAAMIIETLSLYFHIQCFKCGICKGQLGDATTGTDVRIRNGLLNCNDCYVRSRTAGHPTPL